ncbi:hypothetical protein AgCh_000713 [Apium graveolens]
MAQVLQILAQQTANLTRQQQQRDNSKVTFKNFQAVNPPEFRGSSDPIAAKTLLKEIEKSFTLAKVEDGQKTEFASYYLKGEATYWWESVKGLEPACEITWKRFTELFLERFATSYVDSDRKKAKRFQQGLKPWIRSKLAILELDIYAAVVQKAMIAEQESEMFLKEREGKKRRFENKEGSSQGGKFQKKGRFLGRNVNFRRPNVEGIGRLPGHISRDCKMSFLASSALRITGTTPEVIETPRARVFDMTVKDAIQDADVVAGTLTVNSLNAKVLIDSGATKSFISQDFVAKLNCPVKLLNEVMNVELANQDCISVNRIQGFQHARDVKNCSAGILFQDFQKVNTETGEISSKINQPNVDFVRIGPHVILYRSNDIVFSQCSLEMNKVMKLKYHKVSRRKYTITIFDPGGCIICAYDAQLVGGTTGIVHTQQAIVARGENLEMHNLP